MIRRFVLENGDIFESVELNFTKGFIVFSGPSGSGKSVLMNALLSSFGLSEPNAENIETDLIMDEKFLEEFGLEGSDLNIKIVKKDKIRYFVNYAPIAKKLLMQNLGEFIKHIHSRSGDELESNEMLKVLDSFIRDEAHNENLKNLDSSYKEFNKLNKELLALNEDEKHTQNLKEIAEFEINQISSIAPKIGEYEKLLEIKKDLSRVEKTKEAIQNTRNAFEVSGLIIQALNQINKDSSTLQEALNDAQATLEEESLKLEELESMDINAMLERIESLSKLIQKYGSIENALQHLEKQQIKLKELENLSTNKNTIIEKLQNLESTLNILLDSINKKRNENLGAFEAELSNLNNALKLPNANIYLESKSLDSSGNMSLKIKLNKSDISTLSHGEFNRLRLAMLCLSARFNKKNGVLILDEIDANLSGEESEGVAKILKELSSSYQIFAISHQPHMPSLADQHFLVKKENNKSSIVLLNKDGRINEMARMISGENISIEALNFAKKKLENL